MKPDYSFVINYRVVRGSRRENMLLELAREYNMHPKCHLIDRILQDRHKVIMDRASARAEALRKKEDAEKELRRLVAGE